MEFSDRALVLLLIGVNSRYRHIVVGLKELVPF